MKGRKGQAKEAVESGKPTRCPAPPAWLTPAAKEEWRRAAREMSARRILAPDTLATLASYCISVGQVREAEEVMREEGRVIPSDTGPKPHPAFRIQAQAMREARLHAAELGLTPHRRYAGADADKGEDEDVPADLLA